MAWSSLQPIAPHQRPTVAVFIPDGTDKYLKGDYPVDVVCVVKVRRTRDSDDTDTQDMALVQYYDHVLGLEEPCHPSVPGCEYMYLDDTFSFIPTSLLEYPVKLVPEIAPRLTPAVAARCTSSASTQHVSRPPFFWIPELL